MATNERPRQQHATVTALSTVNPMDTGPAPSSPTRCSTPMDTNERLLVQASMTKQASPDTRVWIYRNSAWAYPWYDTVRFILDDDAYSPWFLKFKPNGTTYSPRCDTNYSGCRRRSLPHTT